MLLSLIYFFKGENLLTQNDIVNYISKLCKAPLRKDENGNNIFFQTKFVWNFHGEMRNGFKIYSRYNRIK